MTDVVWKKRKVRFRFGTWALALDMYALLTCFLIGRYIFGIERIDCHFGGMREKSERGEWLK